jgi:hypothetical protein
VPTGEAHARNRAAASQVAGKGKYPMAVRHDVENLIRRGNIFYWRARVPNSFKLCRPGSRLSLSLHCSDHKKAQVIGRKLNMLMVELKMNSKGSMSKEQLRKLCEHERDVMLSHLEDVSIAARRYGTTLWTLAAPGDMATVRRRRRRVSFAESETTQAVRFAPPCQP